MSGEPYSPSGTYPTFPLTLPLDGEVINHSTFVDGILKRMIDGIGYAADNIGAVALAAAHSWLADQTFTAKIIRSGAAARAPQRRIDLAESGSMVVDVSADIWDLGPNTAQRTVTLRSSTPPTPTDGDVIWIMASNGSTNSYIIKREGVGAAIVTLQSTNAHQAAVVWSAAAGRWRLLMAGDGAVPGADAY